MRNRFEEINLFTPKEPLLQPKGARSDTDATPKNAVEIKKPANA